MSEIKIIITDNGQEINITDWMYWFEEQGVEDIQDMKGHYQTFGIVIIVDGKVVYKKKEV